MCVRSSEIVEAVVLVLKEMISCDSAGRPLEELMALKLHQEHA